MTRLNFTLIWLVALGSLVCHQRVVHHSYGRYFLEAFETIRHNSLEKVERQRLFDAAIEGMTSILDRNSHFVNRDEHKRYRSELDQKLTGIGIRLHEDKKKGIFVTDTIVGSPRPAHDAGMRCGDQIVAIDGKSVKDKDFSAASQLIQGRAGTPVRITVIHRGETKPVELTVVRREIQVESVVGVSRDSDGQWRFLLPTKPPIAYVRIMSFGDKTAEELRLILERLKNEGELRALIVDVRDDRGGYLDQADKVCDLFIKEGRIVTTIGRVDDLTGRQERKFFQATGSAPFTGFPMAVLVNQLSASASEIFAACMQDHRRAVIIGTRTFGKGSVQDIYPMESGQSLLALTTARYWRPSGENIDKPKNARPEDTWGVRPDRGFEVPLTPEQETRIREAQFACDAAEQVAPGNPESAVDPQLNRAVEYLRSELPPSGDKEGGGGR